MKTQTAIYSLFFLFSALFTDAQESWETNKGKLQIHPINHASMVWQWDGKTIYFDPVGAGDLYSAYDKPDLVLITHAHGDHFSPATLEAIGAIGVPLVVTQEVADKLDDKFKSNLYIFSNGEKSNILGMEIEAVPAYNYPEKPDAWHPKGVGNGYVIDLGGKRVYVSGDTGNVPEMKNLKNIDLAFLCMNLPYTMDVEDAAKATLAFNPKVIYPYHFRNKDGFSDLQKFKSLVKASNPDIDVRILDWYPQK